MIDYAQIQRVARIFSRRLPHWACVDAEDMAQESALSALRGRKSLTGPMQDALRKQGWIKNHRVGNPPLERIGLDDQRHKHSPESRWSADVDVRSLLDRLTPKQREAVTLHHLAGMTESEMSKALAIPIPRVRDRIHNGLKNMRRFVQ